MLKRRLLYTSILMMGFTGMAPAIAANPPAANVAAVTSQDFPTPLSSNLPYDVDVAVLSRLDRDKQIPEAQRLFDNLRLAGVYCAQLAVPAGWQTRQCQEYGR